MLFQKTFPGHVEHSFGHPTKHFTSSFRYSSSKTPKTTIPWNTLFFWKINLLNMIKIIWTRRIELWKPFRNFYSAFWSFVCQNPKKNDGNIFSLKMKNLGYDLPLDKNNSVYIYFEFFFRKIWVILFEFPKVLRIYSFLRNKIGFPENLLLIT